MGRDGEERKGGRGRVKEREGGREEKKREQREKRRGRKVEPVMRFMTLMLLNRHIENENSE